VTSTTPPAAPPLSLAFGSLLRADFTVLRRSWRLQLLNLGAPLIVLASYLLQRHVEPQGTDAAATLTGTAITFGPLASGVLAYPLGIARDRENGVFRRLRITPAPTWTIMASRLALNVMVTIVVAVIVATIGAIGFGLPLSVATYLLLIPAAIIAGAVFLSLGQAIAGLLTPATLVNAASRVAFIVLYLVGAFGLNGNLSTPFKTFARWSPAGSAIYLYRTALVHAGWTTASTQAVLACLGYILIFSLLGIRYFRWDTP
jgi:ABC-2 type transport system permease protein